MKKSTSLYLDVIRILAAFLVFGSHAYWVLLNHPFGHHFPIPAHAAVIIFFVLSGYVIAFTSFKHESGLKKFVVARLSRLYSVIIPALILTALLETLGRTISPAAYPLDSLFRYVSTGLFLQSAQGLNSSPITNGPFWSLSYEFWYYVLFAVLVFVKPLRWKALVALLCCCVCGVNILLLLPTWTFGVAAFHWKDRFSMSAKHALWGFVITLVCSSFLGMIPEFPAKVPDPPLLFASAFLKDWMFAASVATNIWFLNRANLTVEIPQVVERLIRWTSGHTFSLYLFHVPILCFLSATGIGRRIPCLLPVEIVLTLGACAALGELTEKRRKFLQNGLQRIWDGLAT
jgi:peptidoglycan/LPS O-acetylase OafA/YrhL